MHRKWRKSEDLAWRMVEGLVASHGLHDTAQDFTRCAHSSSSSSSSSSSVAAPSWLLSQARSTENSVARCYSFLYLAMALSGGVSNQVQFADLLSFSRLGTSHHQWAGSTLLLRKIDNTLANAKLRGAEGDEVDGGAASADGGDGGAGKDDGGEGGESKDGATGPGAAGGQTGVSCRSSSSKGRKGTTDASFSDAAPNYANDDAAPPLPKTLVDLCLAELETMQRRCRGKHSAAVVGELLEYRLGFLSFVLHNAPGDTLKDGKLLERVQKTVVGLAKEDGLMHRKALTFLAQTTDLYQKFDQHELLKGFLQTLTDEGTLDHEMVDAPCFEAIKVSYNNFEADDKMRLGLLRVIQQIMYRARLDAVSESASELLQSPRSMSGGKVKGGKTKGAGAGRVEGRDTDLDALARADVVREVRAYLKHVARAFGDRRRASPPTALLLSSSSSSSSSSASSSSSESKHESKSGEGGRSEIDGERGGERGGEIVVASSAESDASDGRCILRCLAFLSKHGKLDIPRSLAHCATVLGRPLAVTFTIIPIAGGGSLANQHYGGPQQPNQQPTSVTLQAHTNMPLVYLPVRIARVLGHAVDVVEMKTVIGATSSVRVWDGVVSHAPHGNGGKKLVWSVYKSGPRLATIWDAFHRHCRERLPSSSASSSSSSSVASSIPFSAGGYGVSPVLELALEARGKRKRAIGEREEEREKK